jgi:hypothetical protein
MHMKRVHIQFTDAQVDALQERATASDRPVSAVVRDVVEAWMADDERRRRIDRALAAVGRFSSGLGDLAENHDGYFVEAIESRIGR